jgi:uncharacterized membrane protein YeaQ/YmgE (transglycosylase-associated protein family)
MADLKDFFSEATSYALIGAPAAIARTIMKRDYTVKGFLANVASCVIVSPLAGWLGSAWFPPKDGHVSGMVYVVIGGATLLGKDILDGLLREGETFAKDPRSTAQAWIAFWKGLFLPGVPK